MPKSTGRPRMRSAAQIDQIRDLHDQGLSYTEIADRLGISRQWARKLAIAPNPEGRMVVWVCKQCKHRWRSTSRYGPERCPECGARDWSRPPTKRQDEPSREEILEQIRRLRVELRSLERQLSKK